MHLDESTGEIEGTSIFWIAEWFSIFNQHLGDDSRLM